MVQVLCLRLAPSARHYTSRGDAARELLLSSDKKVLLRFTEQLRSCS